MMDSIDFMDRHLDPPDMPEYAVCDECGDIFHADDLNASFLCQDCAFKEALEMERE